MIKLNDWEIKEPANTRCYTNQSEAVVVEERNNSVFAKVIVGSDRVVIQVNGRDITVMTTSKTIELK